MARVVRHPQATADLLDIWIYLSEQNSGRRANDLIRRLRHAMNILSAQPLMGRTRDELKAGMRSFPVGNYLIFYYPLEDGVEVVRVLHGHQDTDAVFHEGEDDNSDD